MFHPSFKCSLYYNQCTAHTLLYCFSKLTINATEKNSPPIQNHAFPSWQSTPLKKKQSTNSKPHTLQSYMPSRQSTAPRRRHRCTVCTAPVRQATAACAVLSVPAARGNDAPRCPDDCAPPETHGPTANSSIHFKCCLYSLSACSCSNTLGSTTCKLHSTVHYWWDNQERILAWVWCPWV